MEGSKIDVSKIENVLADSQKTCVCVDEMAYILGVLPPRPSETDPEAEKSWKEDRDAVCDTVRREALKSENVEEYGGGLRYKRAATESDSVVDSEGRTWEVSQDAVDATWSYRTELAFGCSLTLSEPVYGDDREGWWFHLHSRRSCSPFSLRLDATDFEAASKEAIHLLTNIVPNELKEG